MPHHFFRKLLYITTCSSALFLLANPTTTASSTKTSSTVYDEPSGLALSYQNTAIRPQDNFFEYINGQWLKQTPIPGDKTAIGTFYELQDQSRITLRDLLETILTQKQYAKNLEANTLRQFYQDYLNEAHISAVGLTPLKPAFQSIQAIANTTDLSHILATHLQQGVTLPLAAYVDINDKQASEYILKITQSGLGMPDREFYLDTDPRYVSYREQYQMYIDHLLKLANLFEENASQRILAIETQLAQHHWSNVENRDSEKTYNLYSLQTLQALAPNIHWEDFFKHLNIDAHHLAQLVVHQPSYLAEWSQLLNNIPLEDWKLYLQWHLLNDAAPYLPEAFEEANFNFYFRVLSGQKNPQERWKNAVDLVNGSLGELLGKFYVEQHFKPEAKKRMLTLVDNITATFHERLSQLDWMSPETRQAALKKLSLFKAKIGYPDQWHDFSDLKLIPNDLIGNIQRINQHSHRKMLDKLGKPIQTWEWHMSPQTINAYYHPTANEIVFPAGILQPPFFNMQADDAVNYGAIGAIIAHEMGHGFDDQGRKYDGHGNLKDWWTPLDEKKFHNKTKKLIKQFNQYRVLDEVSVNGDLTLGENIGDLTGVSIAYQAYQRSLNHQSGPVLQGYTANQRFFMGYAQVWRIKVQEARQRQLIIIDPHSPAQFRVLGPLSNFKPFYEAFDVKPGDAMYRPDAERVELW